MSATTNNTTTSLDSTIISIEVHGHTFEYLYTRITDRCHVLTALATGKAITFREPETLWVFFAALIARINNKYTPKTTQQLPAPKIAGLLPPKAGMVRGTCAGYLNEHWSPLATDDGLVFETRTGHQYCPHCFTAYHKAMDYIRAQKAAKANNMNSVSRITSGEYHVYDEVSHVVGIIYHWTWGWTIDNYDGDRIKMFDSFTDAVEYAQQYDFNYKAA